VNQVSGGYFETLGIPLLRGRFLTDRDTAESPKVVVINEAAARKYFGENDPIGQPLEFPRKGSAGSAHRIVGIVRDTKHMNLRQPSPRFAFVPLWQPRDAERRITLALTSTVPNAEMALVQPIRDKLARIDPGLLLSDVITIRSQLDSTLLTERLLSGLSTAFGGLALVLAAIGLYGLLNYRIGQQRQSIGVRMALGASPSCITYDVLRQSGLIVIAGFLAGLPFAFLAARMADSMLWGVKSSDPTIYMIAVALLVIVGFASAYVPARRASAIEPAIALRHD
jgi:ABC-type antimicrobial peptide transport system permease subunit